MNSKSRLNRPVAVNRTRVYKTSLKKQTQASHQPKPTTVPFKTNQVVAKPSNIPYKHAQTGPQTIQTVQIHSVNEPIINPPVINKTNAKTPVINPPVNNTVNQKTITPKTAVPTTRTVPISRVPHVAHTQRTGGCSCGNKKK